MKKELIIKILGYVGTIMALLMFISLIEIARKNIISNAHIFIQPFFVTLNCTTWSIYAYLRKDRFVFWANFPGIILAIITFITAFI